MSSPVRHRAASLVLLLLALSACSFEGSAGPTGSAAPLSARPPTPADAPTTTPPPAGPTRAGSSPGSSTGPCQAGQLTGSLVRGNGAAGSEGATVVVRNTSAGTCSLRGYGGISLSRSDGQTVPSSGARVLGTAPALVTLAPGASGRAEISWSRIPHEAAGEPAEGDCQPIASTLNFIPPDKVTPLVIPWTFGPVCGRGLIHESPITSS